MRIAAEDEPALKAWLTRTLEPICDAEPDVLADYTLALVKHPGSNEELRASCIDQLADFLNEEPAPFVDSLFRVIRNREYLPQTSDEVALPFTGKRSIDQIDAVMSSEDASTSLFSSLQNDQGGPSKAQRLPDRQDSTPQRGIGIGRGRGRGRHGPGQGPPRPCYDFHLRGYCARGDSCIYDHSPEAAFRLPGASPQQDGLFAQVDQMQPFFGTDFGPDPAMYPPILPMAPVPQKRNGHQPSVARPPRDRFGDGIMTRSGPATPSLAIDHIPAEYQDEASIRGHFDKFGPIQRIELVQSNSSKAVVHYDDLRAAKAAHDSPEVVFGNRFVKIYWWRPGQSDVPKSERYQNPLAVKATEELKRRQESATRILQIKKEKQALLAKLEEHLGMLTTLLDNPALPATDRTEMEERAESLKREIAGMKESLKPKVKAPSTGASAGMDEESEDPALRAKLEELKSQAISMGMDPDAATANPSFNSTYRGQNYRGYSYRGRASPHRGRGGRAGYGATAGIASYRLDNRSTRLHVENFPADKEDVVRKYLEYTGGLENVSSSKDSDGLIATFKTRQAAEQALAKGSTIPDLGVVKISWASGSDPVPASEAAQATESPTYPLDTLDSDRSWKR